MTSPVMWLVLGTPRQRELELVSSKGAAMSEPHAPSELHPTMPPCLLCHGSQHVMRVDLPDYQHIHHYRCLACGHYWTTNLRGDRILTGQDDDSMLFV